MFLNIIISLKKFLFKWEIFHEIKFVIIHNDLQLIINS